MSLEISSKTTAFWIRFSDVQRYARTRNGESLSLQEERRPKVFRPVLTLDTWHSWMGKDLRGIVKVINQGLRSINALLCPFDVQVELMEDRVKTTTWR